MKTLPIPFLHECFRYEPETGLLHWKHRPREHFNSDRGFVQTNGKYAGKVAGTVSETTGYRVVNLHGGDLHPVHRIVIAMLDGVWPEQIDHVDGIRANNRRPNIRSCTKSDNLCNRGKQLNNTSGFKGVSAKRGRWQANICRHRKNVFLGSFATPELAHAAYKAAAVKYHGAFANVG